jgi:hypothetical protein
MLVLRRSLRWRLRRALLAQLFEIDSGVLRLGVVMPVFCLPRVVALLVGTFPPTGDHGVDVTPPSGLGWSPIGGRFSAAHCVAIALGGGSVQSVDQLVDVIQPPRRIGDFNLASAREVGLVCLR